MDQPDHTPAPTGADQAPKASRPRRRRGPFIATVAALAATLALAFALVYVAHGGGASPSTPAPIDTSFKITQSSAAAPTSAAAIAARVDPGMVNINVANPSTGVAGEATGMVLTPTGVVLTNNHVVQGMTSIKATDIGNGKTYSATVVGYERSADVAVIQLQGASGLQTVPLGDSATVSLGAKVTALGNAGGGGGKPRTAHGSVTGLGQSIIATDIGGINAERLAGLIRTNAAVLPGDSGGPLVNDSGQVVGMDAAAAATNGTYIAQRAGSQGFAIPIDTALGIARQIESGVQAPGVHIGPTGFLGVALMPPSQYSGPGYAGPQGALVARALPGYPAAQAGLAAGDLITSVDGQSVDSANALTNALSAHHPGDSVRIAWTTASGQARSATVKLVSGPAA
jgi:S1-C subfamily serine protease